MIDYISADNGGINFYAGRDDDAQRLNIVGFAKSAKVVAYVLKTKGLADRVMHSSSMDFANEYGFKKNGDAWKMFDEGVALLAE